MLRALPGAEDVQQRQKVVSNPALRRTQLDRPEARSIAFDHLVFAEIG
jgi:hypothetical protein